MADASIPVDDAAGMSVTVKATTTGGFNRGRVISAASTNGTNIGATPCLFYGWHVSNTNAAARYLKIYNKATTPTVGTDTPVFTFLIPPGSSTMNNLFPGMAFGTGIGIGLTTGVADNDTGAVGANEIVVTIFWK